MGSLCFQDFNENFARRLEDRSRKPYQPKNHDFGSLRNPWSMHMGTRNKRCLNLSSFDKINKNYSYRVLLKCNRNSRTKELIIDIENGDKKTTIEKLCLTSSNYVIKTFRNKQILWGRKVRHIIH